MNDRVICAALMGAAAVIFALRFRPRLAAAAWLVLLLAGLLHALALTSQEPNLLGNNLIHHYLGAKYPVPYSAYYEVAQAAKRRPQIGMTDLEHPPAVLRSTPAEQRAYYIDLLRARGVAFDPLAPLHVLADEARDSRAIESEADSVLLRNLPPSRIEPYRADVARVAPYLLTTDFGFNGSPFYALLRRADPMLHRPFGPAAGWVSLVWQIAFTLLLAWVSGAALGLATFERLAIAALLFASWDFVGYALSGLVFGEVWVPVALAIFAMSRGRAVAAGVAIAWAGLLKLFPFALVAPSLLAITLGPRFLAQGEPLPRSWHLRLLGSTGISSLLLIVAGTMSGRTWTDFLHKIVVEFEAPSQLGNSVSLDAWLLTAGIPHDSPIGPALTAFALLVLGAMLVGRQDTEALSRRSLVLLTATGWLVHNWLNYYAVVPFLLIPLQARAHRWVVAGATLALAATFALPEFADSGLLAKPWIHAAKIAPYLLIPAWLVFLELRDDRRGPWFRRGIGIAAAILVLATAGEAWRAREIREAERRGQQLLEAGNPAPAAEQFRRATRLAPDKAPPRMKEAIALAELGRIDEALAGFERAAELAPEDAAVLDNFGRALMLVGRWDEAARKLEKARDLRPHDPQILVSLARVRLAQRRPSDAIALLQRARELDPDSPTARAGLEQLRPLMGATTPAPAGGESGK